VATVQARAQILKSNIFIGLKKALKMCSFTTGKPKTSIGRNNFGHFFLKADEKYVSFVGSTRLTEDNLTFIG
jgi:hypothetical protein